MSHDGEASTARQEPSLTDITNRNPFSISTMVWLTTPASKQRAAPWVRLASPEATAASWSALARSRRSETAMSSPSADTTIAWATPGTLLAKFVTSQLRFWASLLSCIVVAPRGGRNVAGPVVVPGSHHAPTLEPRAVARQHAPDLLRGPGGGGGGWGAGRGGGPGGALGAAPVPRVGGGGGDGTRGAGGGPPTGGAPTGGTSATGRFGRSPARGGRAGCSSPRAGRAGCSSARGGRAGAGCSSARGGRAGGSSGRPGRIGGSSPRAGRGGGSSARGGSTSPPPGPARAL